MFDAKQEKKFYELAKKFGRLNIREVNLSLLPKDPKTLDLDSVSVSSLSWTDISLIYHNST